MKSITLIFENEEFEKIRNLQKKLRYTWRAFVLYLCDKELADMKGVNEND